jgi:probable HAF family extracellular repeat protein
MFGEDQFYDDWCFFDYYATDINFHGEIVGTNRDFATYKWGFLWAGANGITLFPDAFQTAVNGINNVAQVVGQTGDVELFQESHAALWSAQGKMDLGTLGGDSSDWSYCSGANSINDLSGVVGWSTTVSEPLFACPDLVGVHAFYWKAGAGMQDLGTLPGDTASVARKINFFGQVIGDSGNTVVWHDGDPSGWIEVTGRPFIWTQHGGMQDLNALIPANSGWVLNSVSGINVWGQIVGSGTRNGQPHGFLLTPTLSSTRRHGERERD